MNQWQQTTLGAISTVQSGSSFPKKYQIHTQGEYPFVKVGDMNMSQNTPHIYTSTFWINEKERNELKSKIFPAGSVIFPKVGGAIHTNKKRLVKIPCCADNNVIGIIPNLNYVTPEFIFFWMLKIKISEFANDSELPSIRKTTVENFPLYITSLSEQERIVAILDEAFEAIDTAIANTEKNLSNTEELFQSVLETMLSP